MRWCANKRRDLSLISIGSGKKLLVACDSCGGVGEKEADTLCIPPFYVGAYTARVVMMELLSSGCSIVTLADNLCCEMHPTGTSVLQGIRSEMDKAKLPHSILTGSTEENLPTVMTAVGVTGIGLGDEGALKFHPARRGDHLIAVGTPKVGNEVIPGYDSEIASYKDIRFLVSCEAVLEIAPAGSGGIVHECQELAALNQLNFRPINSRVNIHKSAGPATCLVALVKQGGLGVLSSLEGRGLEVGTLE